MKFLLALAWITFFWRIDAHFATNAAASHAKIRQVQDGFINIFPGDNFELTMSSLKPGDTVIVHQGDHIITDKVSIAVAGTSTLPVVVQKAANETRPRILLSSTAAIQNTINIEGATHLTIKGLEILSNGGDGIRIGPGVRGNSHITLEDLIIRDVVNGINAQSNVDKLTVRKSHIYDISGDGKALYLGCSDGSCIVSNSLIDNNWVHETQNSELGEGIELNKNSFANIIRNNVVYNTRNPGILLYGSGGGAQNVVEGNVMWNCFQGGIQVSADAVVQNNVVFESGYGLISHSWNEVDPKNLTIVHNTILIYNGACLKIRDWNGKSDITFANNAVYCLSDDTMDLQGGTQNVQLAGNVFFPSAAAFPPGTFVLGRGIAQDFGSGSLNAYPTVDSPLRTAADARYAIVADFEGTTRSAPVDVGGYEWFAIGREWEVRGEFKPPQSLPVAPQPLPPVPVPIAPVPSPPVQRPQVAPQPLPPVPIPLAPLPTFEPNPEPLYKKDCFSDRNTVQVVRHHEVEKEAMVSPDILHTISISDLAVGDYVPSGKGNGITRVISFCHRDPHANASFVRMLRPPLFIGELNATSDITVPLEMSADHLVLVLRHGSANAIWMRAADVQVGDRLTGRDGPQVVSSIETLQRTGVYAPITESGTLRVSGAVVSSYVAVLNIQLNESSYVPMFPPNWQHSLGHVVVTPIRLMCRFSFKYCQEERYDEHGFPWYSKLIVLFINFFDCGKGFVLWMMPLIATVHVCATVLVSVVCVLLHGMEHVLFGSGPMDLEDGWNVEVGLLR